MKMKSLKDLVFGHYKNNKKPVVFNLFSVHHNLVLFLIIFSQIYYKEYFYLLK